MLRSIVDGPYDYGEEEFFVANVIHGGRGMFLVYLLLFLGRSF